VELISTLHLIELLTHVLHHFIEILIELFTHVLLKCLVATKYFNKMWISSSIRCIKDELVPQTKHRDELVPQTMHFIPGAQIH